MTVAHGYVCFYVSLITEFSRLEKAFTDITEFVVQHTLQTLATLDIQGSASGLWSEFFSRKNM